MATAAPSALDYLDHLARESDRFAAAVSAAAPDAPVPSCPDWTADDLLWHLGEVQWFWATIVRDGVDGDTAEARKPARPGGRAALAEFFASASRDLAAALAAAPPEQPAWTWSADHTVGFIRRRQAHEALIHRVDAELTAGAGRRSGMDPELSSDGVEEALRIMFGWIPEWGTFSETPGAALQIRAADTATSWSVSLGRFAGTSPEGTSYDEPALTVADVPADNAAAVITGAAADLDCWLWGRPPSGPIERSGDPATLAGFEAVIAAGIT